VQVVVARDLQAIDDAPLPAAEPDSQAPAADQAAVRRDGEDRVAQSRVAILAASARRSGLRFTAASSPTSTCPDLPPHHHPTT